MTVIDYVDAHLDGQLLSSDILLAQPVAVFGRLENRGAVHRAIIGRGDVAINFVIEHLAPMELGDRDFVRGNGKAVIKFDTMKLGTVQHDHRLALSGNIPAASVLGWVPNLPR